MLALLISLAVANTAFDGALAKAKRLYGEAEWDAALRELTIAERNAASDAERLKVLLYQGVVLANVPDLDSAQTSWERALLIDGEATLPLAVTPKIQAHFDRVKRTVRSTREAMLKAQAKADTPVKAEPLTPAASSPDADLSVEATRPVPIAPFVVGGLGIVAAGTGIALTLSAMGLVDRALASEWYDEKVRFHGEAQTQANIAYAMFAVAGTAAVTAVILYLVMR